MEGSNALDSSVRDPTDVRLDYGDMNIVGPRRLKMPFDGGTIDNNSTAIMVDQTEIQKQENNKAAVTSSGPDGFVEVVTCRLRTGKPMRTDDSSTPEQLNWTAEALQQDMKIKYFCAR